MNAVGTPAGALHTRTDALRGSLLPLTGLAGLVRASLVETGSAHVLDTVRGDAGPADDPPAGPEEGPADLVAAAAADVVQVLRMMTAGLGGPDDLEDVVVTLGRHHHLVRVLPGAGADGLFLLVTLDRSRTNLALARRQLRTVDPGLVP